MQELQEDIMKDIDPKYSERKFAILSHERKLIRKR